MDSMSLASSRVQLMRVSVGGQNERRGCSQGIYASVFLLVKSSRIAGLLQEKTTSVQVASSSRPSLSKFWSQLSLLSFWTHGWSTALLSPCSLTPFSLLSGVLLYRKSSQMIPIRVCHLPFFSVRSPLRSRDPCKGGYCHTVELELILDELP